MRNASLVSTGVLFRFENLVFRARSEKTGSAWKYWARSQNSESRRQKKGCAFGAAII
jgi:hypothetical protein